MAARSNKPRSGASKPGATMKTANRPLGRDSKAQAGRPVRKGGAGKGAGKTARRPGPPPRRLTGRPRVLPAASEVRSPPKKDHAETQAVAIAAIDAALDKKALMPVLIDVSGLASYTDFIGIVSGRSDRQVDAIAEGVIDTMKRSGRSVLGQEGKGSGRWTLLDFGDVVVHVFYHPVREFYDLESLWVDAPRIPLKIPPEAILTQPDALYGGL